MATENFVESGVAIAVKLGPPSAVSTALVSGVDINSVLIYLTIFYTVILISHKLWSIYKEISLGKEGGA